MKVGSVYFSCMSFARAASSLAAAILTGGTASAQFEGERRLDAQLTYVSRARPVHETIDAISKVTGVELRVAPDIRDDLIILRAVDVRASELLKRIAEHFSWSWRAKDGGWELYRTADQAKAENKAVREQIIRRYTDKQREVREQLEKASTASQDELEKLVRPTTGGVIADRDWALISNNQRIYRIAKQALPNATARVLASLTENQWWELYTLGRFVLSTAPNMAQHRLVIEPALLERILSERQAAQERLIALRAEHGNQEWIEWLLRRSFDNSDIAALRIALVEGNRNSDIQLHVGTATSYLLKNGMSVLYEMDFGFFRKDFSPIRQRTNVQRPRTPLDEISFPDAAAKRISPTTREDLEARFFGPIREFWKSGSKSHPFEVAGGMMTDFAEAVGRNIISDVYEKHMYAIQRLGNAWNSAAAFLDGYCSLSDLDWSEDGGWIRILANDWQLARHSLVPASTLFALRDSVYSVGGYTLDSMGEAAAKLNHEQALSLMSYIAGLRFDSRTYHGAKLWNAVGSTVRAGLRSGAAVPFAALTPSARELFRTCLLRGDESLSSLAVFDEVEKTFIANMKAAIGYGDEDTSAAMSAHEITDYLGGGIPSDATLELRSVVTPAFQIKSAFRDLELYDLAYAGSVYVKSAQAPLSEPTMVRVGQRELSVLILRLPSGAARGIVLDARWVNPNSEWQKITDLPPDLLARMRKAYEAMPKPIIDGGGD